MSNPEVRAEPEVKCDRCDAIWSIGVLEGLESRHWVSVYCPTCGQGYEVTLEVEPH